MDEPPSSDSSQAKLYFKNKGEINEDIKSMLAGEVPRLILKDYEECYNKKLIMKEDLDRLQFENLQLSQKVNDLESEMHKSKEQYKYILDEYKDLNDKY